MDKCRIGRQSAAYGGGLRALLQTLADVRYFLLTWDVPFGGVIVVGE